MRYPNASIYAWKSSQDNAAQILCFLFLPCSRKRIQSPEVGCHILHSFYLGVVVPTFLFPSGIAHQTNELWETTWFHFRVLSPWCRLSRRCFYSQQTSLKPFEQEPCWGCVVILLGDVGHQDVTTRIKSELQRNRSALLSTDFCRLSMVSSYTTCVSKMGDEARRATCNSWLTCQQFKFWRKI